MKIFNILKKKKYTVIVGIALNNNSWVSQSFFNVFASNEKEAYLKTVDSILSKNDKALHCWLIACAIDDCTYRSK